MERKFEDELQSRLWRQAIRKEMYTMLFVLFCTCIISATNVRGLLRSKEDQTKRTHETQRLKKAAVSHTGVGL